MLRIDRNPIIGDKFASRHGQKGVCSMMYPVENLPFTESGMTPDIIFNPHGYPSRMTIGMMIESMAGKSAASYGHCYDATPFQFSEDDPAIDHFGNMLVKAGYNYHGTERFYSGIDGRELEASIFMGVVYYQRLRHMVSDKFQVRTTGPIDQVTYQPVKGRKKGGGVRFGEMERDALISHGTSFLLQDRLLNCSDKSMAPVCTDCGSLLSVYMEKRAPSTAAASHEKQLQWSCLHCKSCHIEIVTIPYVFRYLVAELAAMNIKVEVTVKD
ncbi:DNA-directed RNA polymerase I subunit RPA2-like [Ruditapes philippinarum]|uniref:DNA-directed RNA polymerase I subunit RPA2-like n=1 Tax=Ruditapes philippinarum TaxID=129788 RepID=UPI00295BA804|nr:DNA-directed RNA polymerase I subunit RPA2-like [Ruditapes philippinarum]